MFLRRTVLTGVLALLIGGMSSTSAYAAPNLEVLGQDDGTMVLNNWEKRDYALCTMRLWGATHIRIIIYEERVRKFGFARYDAAVNRAINSEGYGNGRKQRCPIPWQFQVQLVITGLDRQWSSGEFGDFAHEVVTHFKGRVHRYSLYNEPNASQWLTPDKGRSQVETYRRVFLEGYRGLKSADPDAEVLLGELWNAGNAREFLTELLSQPLPPVDGVALHPYTREHPRERTESPRLEMGTLWAANEIVRDAYEAGRITTPEGARPLLYLTEFAIWSRSKGAMEDKNIENPRQRANRVIAAWLRACRTPFVAQMSQYMFFPALPGWEGEWDTSIIKPNGRPDGVLLKLSEWLREKHECTETEPDLPLPSPAGPTIPSLPTTHAKTPSR